MVFMPHCQSLLLSQIGEGLTFTPSIMAPLTFDEDISPGTNAYDLLGFGEYILEIEPTPNRGALLSVKGLARDILTCL